MLKRDNIQIIGDSLTVEDYQKQNKVHPGQISDIQEAKYVPELLYVKTKYKYLKYKKK